MNRTAMKSLVVLLILVCLFLTGCFQFHKLTTLRIKGKVLKVPFGSIAPVEGEDVQATLTREVRFTTTKQRGASTLSDVTMQEESADKGGMDIKK